MKFKRARGVGAFEAWTNQGGIRLDDENPVCETEDPGLIELLEASPFVVRAAKAASAPRKPKAKKPRAKKPRAKKRAAPAPVAEGADA